MKSASLIVVAALFAPAVAFAQPAAQPVGAVPAYAPPPPGYAMPPGPPAVVNGLPVNAVKPPLPLLRRTLTEAVLDVPMTRSGNRSLSRSRNASEVGPFVTAIGLPVAGWNPPVPWLNKT